MSQAKKRPLIKRPLDVSKCGTDANYRGHKARGEEACDPCKKAHNEYSRAARKSTDTLGRSLEFDPAKCGTYANASRHRRRGEELCGPCLEARREYNRKASKPKRQTHCSKGHLLDPNRPQKSCQVCLPSVFDPTKCGTPSNYGAHARFGVPVCDPCRKAASKRARAYEAKKPPRRRRRPAAAPPPVRRLPVPAFLAEMYGDVNDDQCVPA